MTKLSLTVSVKASKASNVRMNLRMVSRRQNPIRMCNVYGIQRDNIHTPIERSYCRNDVGEIIGTKTAIKEEEDGSIDEPYNSSNVTVDNEDNDVNERMAIKRESIPNIQLTPEMMVKYNMTIMPPRFRVPKWTPMYPR